MTILNKSLKHFLILAGMLLAGLYFGGTALWNMAKTAVYLHESTVLTARVVDMVQYPFDSYSQALEHGNLPWEGETAYRATVCFTLPTTPVAIDIPRLQLPDLDNCDYAVGQEVEVIVPLTDPERAHLYRWKFLWGADCMLLALGLLLAGPAYLLLRTRKPKQARAAAPKSTPNQHRPAPKPERKPAQKPTAKPAAKAPAQPAPAPEPAEDVFRLEATPPEPKKKRSRKKKSESGSTPAKGTGTRRRKKSAEG